MTEALERVRQARAEAFEAKQAIEQRITETLARIAEICTRGTLPFDEAFPAWRKAFESYADTGREELERSFGEFARPNTPHPLTGTLNRHATAHTAFQVRQYGDGTLHDIGAVFAHLNREAITESARAWFSETCEASNVPPAAKRKAEAERLADELRALEAERDDMQDQLSELFQAEPSERTRQAERKSEAQGHVDRLNAYSEQRAGRG